MNGVCNFLDPLHCCFISSFLLHFYTHCLTDNVLCHQHTCNKSGLSLLHLQVSFQLVIPSHVRCGVHTMERLAISPAIPTPIAPPFVYRCKFIFKTKYVIILGHFQTLNKCKCSHWFYLYVSCWFGFTWSPARPQFFFFLLILFSFVGTHIAYIMESFLLLQIGSP